MKEKKFTLNYQDPAIWELVQNSDKRILAIWARDCATRKLGYFEKELPFDDRPRKAIETLQKWIDSGEFKMAVIRGASLASHAAAREVGEDNPSRSAARCAGQAVATAHVKTHSLAAANYALQAVFRKTNSWDAVKKERKWQYDNLIKLNKERV